jgi:hypothetical protein
MIPRDPTKLVVNEELIITSLVGKERNRDDSVGVGRGHVNLKLYAVCTFTPV